MNVLVFELQIYSTMNKSKIQENYFEKELKDKIYYILSKYLDDREYLEKKVDNWRDAILKEVEKLFLDYKDYKTFINLIIKKLLINQILIEHGILSQKKNLLM